MAAVLGSHLHNARLFAYKSIRNVADAGGEYRTAKIVN